MRCVISFILVYLLVMCFSIADGKDEKTQSRSKFHGDPPPPSELRTFDCTSPQARFQPIFFWFLKVSPIFFIYLRNFSHNSKLCVYFIHQRFVSRLHLLWHPLLRMLSSCNALHLILLLTDPIRQCYFKNIIKRTVYCTRTHWQPRVVSIIHSLFIT